MAIPTVNSVGAVFGGIGSVTGTPGASHTADDIDIILLECADSDTASLSTANGFARLTALDQTVGSAGAGAQMSVWWRRWNGSDGNPVFADAGDHQIGRMISISGCITTGDPWDITGTGTTDSSADTSVSIAGGTTTVADCLILGFVCQNGPDANTTTEFGAPTNGDLANLTEQADNSRNAGAGGAIYIVTGEKATAGTFGATTLTAATSALRVCGILALKPPTSTQGLTGTLFQSSPTFFTGTVGRGAVDLAGTLFQKAPTFFTGAVTFSYALTGTLFQNTPSFPQGAVAVGAVDLGGTLFTKAPTFFTGEVANASGSQDLTGTLFTKAPTFPTGTVAATYALTGTLFTKAPTFFAGTVATGYVGGLPTAAVIGVWDARSLSGADTDPVASWADLGPVPQSDLAQSNSTFRPTITDSGFGGIRSVLFDGSNDRLDVTLDQSYTGDFAFIVVLELLTYPTGSAAVAYSTGTVPNKNILGVDDVEEPPGWVVMSGPEGTAAEHHHGTVLDLTAVPLRVVMTQLVRNSGEHKLWERSVLVINESDSAGGDPLNNLGALKLGAREDNTRFMNMRLAYVLLVDMADTDETTLLAARDDLGEQFAVPGMDTQAAIGVLFEKAPTFFAGTVTPGAVALTGTLFQKAPTFFTGAATATYILTGTLFQSAPTFPQGAVTAGAVDLAGTLFQKAPTFFTGTVSSGATALAGTLFQKAPTFPQGAVTAGAVGLTGVLFQKAPTFPTGTVAVGAVNLDGVLFQSTPTFFTGLLASGGSLFGVLFQSTPTFFAGTVDLDTTGAFWTRNPAGYTLNPAAYTLNPAGYDPIGPDEIPPWGFEIYGTLFQKSPTFFVGAVS